MAIIYQKPDEARSIRIVVNTMHNGVDIFRVENFSGYGDQIEQDVVKITVPYEAIENLIDFLEDSILC